MESIQAEDIFQRPGDRYRVDHIDKLQVFLLPALDLNHIPIHCEGCRETSQPLSWALTSLGTVNMYSHVHLDPILFTVSNWDAVLNIDNITVLYIYIYI